MKNFDDVTHEEMVNILAKDGQAILDSMTAENMHALHMAVGLCGEISGEFIPACVNNDLENLIEELGDVEFYFQGLKRCASDWYGTCTVSNEYDPAKSLCIFSGEILGQVKKAAIYNKSLDVIQLGRFMDQFNYDLGRLYLDIGVTRDEVKQANKDKLSKRYHSLQYSDDQAQERADKENGE